MNQLQKSAICQLFGSILLFCKHIRGGTFFFFWVNYEVVLCSYIESKVSEYVTEYVYLEVKKFDSR